MSTQFVSKNSNYMVVLKSGIEGNRLFGTQPIAGLYVKFDGGIVTVKEESVIELLRNHPSFGTDFIEVGENQKDPFIDARTEIEPNHIVSDIKYGHVEKDPNNQPKTKISPQMKKLIEVEAIKMLPDLLKSNPKILKDIITSMAAEMKAKEEAQVSQPKDITEDPIKNVPGKRTKVE